MIFKKITGQSISEENILTWVRFALRSNNDTIISIERALEDAKLAQERLLSSFGGIMEIDAYAQTLPSAKTDA